MSADIYHMIRSFENGNKLYYDIDNNLVILAIN